MQVLKYLIIAAMPCPVKIDGNAGKLKSNESSTSSNSKYENTSDGLSCSRFSRASNSKMSSKLDDEIGRTSNSY